MQSLQGFKAELFRALASPVRIRIIEVLRAAGSLTVGEIQQRVGLEASNVSQHLSILRARGIVSARREGTSVWYSVNESDVFALLDTARAIFGRQLDQQQRLLEDSELGTSLS